MLLKSVWIRKCKSTYPKVMLFLKAGLFSIIGYLTLFNPTQ